MPDPGLSPTAEVVISYAREDSRKARSLVKQLERQRWSVWWDRDLKGGQDYERFIRAQLEAARCVIVLWSRHAAASPWVRGEGNIAADRRVLLPVRLDETALPIAWSTIHAESLTDWSGNGAHPALTRLLQAVGHMLGQAPIPPPPPPRPPWVAVGVLAAVLPLVLVLSSVPVSAASVRLDLRLSRVGFVVREEGVLLTEPLRLFELGVAGLRGVTIPAGPSGPGAEYSGRLALLTAAGPEGGRGTLSLELGVLAPGARLSLGERRLSLSAPVRELGVSVHGPVRVVIPPTHNAVLRFEHGRIALRPGGTTVDFEFEPSAATAPRFAARLEVDSLDLSTWERIREGTESAVLAVSTILSGTLAFEAKERPPVPLEKGQALGFAESRGEIRSLAVREGEISLVFAGTVSGMTTGPEDARRNLMPSVLRALWARQRMLVALAAVVYLVALAAVGYRVRRAVA